MPDCSACGAPVIYGQRADDGAALVLDRHEQSHGSPRYIERAEGFVPCRDDYEQLAYLEHSCQRS